MALAGIAQILFVILLTAALAPALGAYMTGVYSRDESGPAAAPGDRLLLPVEGALYRLLRIDPAREQSWSAYAIALLAFSAVSVLALYALLRLQAVLPLNPTGMPAVPGPIAFNTAVSFMTNTNWQAYGGEQTLSHLSQMAGLTVQNFVSAAAGMAVLAALIRGLVRRRAGEIGNFWTDLIRGITRVLLPMSVLFALALVASGVIQNLGGFTETATGQLLPGGPAASQIAIKQLGTNGGGFFNINSAHPFENAGAISNMIETFALVIIPFGLVFMYGRMVGDRRQGWVLAGVMAILWIGSIGLATWAEQSGNEALERRGVDQELTAEQPGGSMEGKEARYGPAGSALWAASTTGTSNGSVNSMHDSFTALGGLVPLANMMLGEVSPGGVGVGLTGMLVYAILAVFLVGLMVGRTPEFLGKKIGPPQIKLVALYLLAMPATLLAFTGVSVVTPAFADSIQDRGAHGLTEVLYAFGSGSNNNGSAFAGFGASDNWYAITIGVAMLIGRFALIIPVLAIAGSLVRATPAPASAGTMPTNTPLFGVVLVFTVLVVAGLVLFPSLTLGPIAEHLQIVEATP